MSSGSERMKKLKMLFGTWANPRNDDPWNEDADNCLHLSYNILQNREKRSQKLQGWEEKINLENVFQDIYTRNPDWTDAGFLTSLPVITMWRWLKGVVFFCMLSATNESGNQTLLGLLKKPCKLPVYGIITKSKQRCLCVPLGCDGLCTIRRLFPLQRGFNRSDSTPSSVRVQLQS